MGKEQYQWPGYKVLFRKRLAVAPLPIKFQELDQDQNIYSAKSSTVPSLPRACPEGCALRFHGFPVKRDTRDWRDTKGGLTRPNHRPRSTTASTFAVPWTPAKQFNIIQPCKVNHQAYKQANCCQWFIIEESRVRKSISCNIICFTRSSVDIIHTGCTEEGKKWTTCCMCVCVSSSICCASVQHISQHLHVWSSCGIKSELMTNMQQTSADRFEAGSADSSFASRFSRVKIP